MGFGVWVLGFGVLGLGFAVWDWGVGDQAFPGFHASEEKGSFVSERVRLYASCWCIVTYCRVPRKALRGGIQKSIYNILVNF